MIRVQSLSKEFQGAAGALLALDRISLEIEEGQFVSIVGPSGCGKSTLLKIVGGIEAPTDGSVEIALPNREGRISDFGFCFQDPTLLPWLDVVQNVLLPYRVSRTHVVGARERALDLLRLVGLGEFINANAWELSGGMQSRVALCRALVHAPRILLLDEPFAALDALTRETLLFELQAIWLRQRPTTLLVTHSIHEAVMLSDLVIVMGNRPGRVRAIVPTGLERPRRPDHQYTPAFADCERRIKAMIFDAEGHAT